MKKLLFPLLLLIAALGILVPSMISNQLEEVVEGREQDLRAQIPDNDSLYAALYQSPLPDSAAQTLGMLQARVIRAEGQLSQMWIRLDSADERRKNKAYDFLVKEGQTQQLLGQLTELDSLMQDIAPGVKTELGLFPLSARHDTTWTESYFTGQAFTARIYVTRWAKRLKQGEKRVLEEVARSYGLP